MDMFILLTLCSLAAFAKGQFDGHNHRHVETGIGYFDGRELLVDEGLLGRERGFDRIGGGRGQLMPRRRFDRDRLRPCRALSCTLEFIPPRCRYTPVYQTAFGDYCLGCPEDVCEPRRRRLTNRQRRRRRRLRRRLCRQFGMCFGQGSRMEMGNPLGAAMF